MHEPTVVLYDSGRFPLWFRLPSFLFAAGVLVLGLALAIEGLFGLKLLDASGSPIGGALTCFAIAYLWTLVWLMQLCIVFHRPCNEVIVRTRGFTGWWQERISVTGARAIEVCYIRSDGIGGGRKQRVQVEYESGERKRLIDLSSGGDDFATKAAELLHVPVVQQEVPVGSQ